MYNKLKNQAGQQISKIRRPVFRLIFSRTFMSAVFLALQVILTYIVLFRLTRYSAFASQLVSIVSAVIIIIIYNSRTNEAYRLSWTLLVAVLPVFGLYMYFMARANPLERHSVGRLERRILETRWLIHTDETVQRNMSLRTAAFQKLSGYLERIGSFASYENTEVKYYPLGDDVLEDICDALDSAKEFIFLEFFIIQEGYFWNRILDILKQKVSEGIEVRVLYDGVGSYGTLPVGYYRTLTEMGILCRRFSPVYPLFSTHYNNRDHRKIMVVDGRIAFSGGFNIADEYINRRERFGHWKDNAFRLKGDAVRSYTLMFLQVWNTGERSDSRERIRKYVYAAEDSVPAKGSGGVFIPYGDGPYTSEALAKNVYVDIIDGADDHVNIMTPYLIPDNDTMHSIKHAAKSGVDVRIILPHIPDKKLVFLMTRSYYRELLASGVHIYEYVPGFVHTKLVSADRKIAATGTVNLDFRSFYLHYECGCIMYDDPVLQDIEADFSSTLSQCVEITLGDVKSWSKWSQLCACILRIAAPLL